MQPEELTQDPFIPSPPQNNPNEVDEESLDDTEGKDLPVDTSAFDRADFGISDLGDGLEAIDISNLADVY